MNLGPGSGERGTGRPPADQAAGLLAARPPRSPLPAPRSGGEAALAIGLPAIAITGGKGGVGKTCIAVNLAVVLAKLGLKPLLVDLDLGLANADVLLGVTPEHTLADVVLGGQSVASIITPTPFGFGFLPAASGIDELSTATQTQLHTLFAGLMVLAKNYDLLVIDTPAGIGREVMTALRSSRIVAVVVTPDPTSLTDAYATIKVLVGQQKRQNIRLIVNQTSRPGDGRAITVQLQQVVDRFVPGEPGKPIKLVHLGDIPVDTSVRQAVMRRQLLMQVTPGCPAGLALVQLAGKIEDTVIPKGN